MYLSLLKDWFLKKLRKPKTLVTLLTSAIGAIMILVGKSNSACFGIGISVLSSGIISLISFTLLYDEDDFKTTKEWGLEGVYNTRGAMNDACDKYMPKSKSLRAIGFGFKSLRDAQEHVILEMLKKGGNIQIITMKPGCQALQIRQKDEGQDIGNSIESLIKWADELNKMDFPGKIEIRYHDHIPSYFVFILDNRLYTGPYEYGKASQQTISFEYCLTGKAYEYYTSYFDRLWNNKSFCENALEQQS